MREIKKNETGKRKLAMQEAEAKAKRRGQKLRRKNGTVKIQQSKKGETITAKMEAIPLSPIPPLSHEKPWKPPQTFSLKIIASPDDWRVLYYFSHKYLGELIFNHAVRPAYKEKIEPLEYPPARGTHNETQAEFTEEMKKIAAIMISYTSHWLDKPRDEWPEPFTDFVDSLSVREKADVRTASKKLSLNKLVWAMWKQRDQERMKEVGLTGPTNLKSFVAHYISKNNFIEPAKYFFQECNSYSTTEEIITCLLSYLP